MTVKNLRTSYPVQLPNYGVETHFSIAKGDLITQTPMENFIVTRPNGLRVFISSVGTYCEYEREAQKAEVKKK